MKSCFPSSFWIGLMPHSATSISGYTAGSIASGSDAAAKVIVRVGNLGSLLSAGSGGAYVTIAPPIPARRRGKAGVALYDLHTADDFCSASLPTNSNGIENVVDNPEISVAAISKATSASLAPAGTIGQNSMRGTRSPPYRVVDLAGCSALS